MPPAAGATLQSSLPGRAPLAAPPAAPVQRPPKARERPAAGSGHVWPRTAFMIGLAFPGAGQLYNEQVLKGLLCMAGTIALFFEQPILGLLVHFTLSLDAYIIAAKRRLGKRVAGYEFF